MCVCVLVIQIIAGGNEIQKIMKQINLECGMQYQHYSVMTRLHTFLHTGDYFIATKDGVEELLVSLYS